MSELPQHRDTSVPTGHALVVLHSPYGPVALTREQLCDALELGREVGPIQVAVDHGQGYAKTSRLLDAAQAAERLGIRASWLLQRARERRIPHSRIGKYVRFDVELVRAAMSRGEIPT